MPKILIELDVRGRSADGLHVVNALLDVGHLQDSINDHDCTDVGRLRVTSAKCYLKRPPQKRQSKKRK